MPSIVVTNAPFIPVAPKLFIGATGAGVAIECAAEDILIEPTQDSSTIETFCSVQDTYKPPKWTITASCFLSYGTTGLWTALNPLTQAVQQFAFVPNRAVAVSVDNPMMTGNAYVPAIAFYSAAVGTPNAINVILAVQGLPTFVITGTLPTMADAESFNVEDEHAVAGVIEVDTSAADRGLRSLSGGLENAARAAGVAQAARTANAIRGRVPVRTGRLRGTVTADGNRVTYGGGLRYAGYIEKRSHAVAAATANDDDDFHREMVIAAEREVGRL